jgi:hypothetical protein
MICPTCRTAHPVNKDGGIRRHSCKPVPGDSFALRWAAPPLTKNMVRRLHHMREAQLRRDAITEARWTIRAALKRGEIRPMIGANITLHWRMADARRRDGDGAQPTLSLLIDALVLEGVLPDDSWVHVVHSGVTCHPPRRGMPGAMWLELVEPVGEAS